jgi:RNA 2',3'-cyclic 3'-phosphodiesterase
MRLFVGLALPLELRQRLAGLGGGIPGARWVPGENFHLTLRFLGELAPFQAEEIDHVLASLKARRFDLTLAGMGTFTKGGRDTQLWVGIARNPSLELLQSKVEQAVQRAGLPPERRRFAAHVTLARLDNAVPAKVAAFVQTHNLFRADPVAVDHFCLFSSRLGKEASAYTVEVEYGLL